MPTRGSRQENGSTGFRRGQRVTVRGLNEILATLDADAKLEGLPFILEMAPLCGKTFRVFRRAEKTCVEGVGLRSMKNTVFLEGLRCDGSAHDGCQRGCLFFWKNAWLKPAGKDGTGVDTASGAAVAASSFIRDASQLPTTKGDLFFCQSTELASATGEFQRDKLRTYLRDMRIGEMSPWRFAYIMLMALLNRVWRLLRGRSYYEVTGEQKKTLTQELNLQPGELVEIKSAAEIQATLDAKGRNRGLSFEPEMAQHCGRRYRVGAPLRTIVSEQSGKMLHLNNTVVLEGLICRGMCSLNCPRANYFYWREIWLKRVSD